METVRLEFCTFRDNLGSMSPEVYLDGGDVVVADCTFQMAEHWHDSTVWCPGGTDVKVLNCLFEANGGEYYSLWFDNVERTTLSNNRFIDRGSRATACRSREPEDHWQRRVVAGHRHLLLPRRVVPASSRYHPGMLTLLRTMAALLRDLLRSRLSMQIEILALRHQLGVYQRVAKRPPIRAADRLLWVWLSRHWSRWREVLILVRPETVIAWRRRRFRAHWAKLSRCGRPGRPTVPREVRDLIR
jgi:hypothetical protein